MDSINDIDMPETDPVPETEAAPQAAAAPVAKEKKPRKSKKPWPNHGRKPFSRSNAITWNGSY